jgi:SulP family sulfate permease
VAFLEGGMASERKERPGAEALPPLRPAAALREAFAQGYGARDLRRDAMAGLVVGIVALPLSMALAIAAGVPPQHGLYTAIVAGGVSALLGGSRTLVSGPTAAFVAILLPIATRWGLGGLVLASLMAGLILCVLGLARMGRLIRFVPNPVTTGFTAGIAVVIATIQLKDFFGLSPGPLGEHTPERVAGLIEAAGTARWQETVVGVATLALLIFWPRVTKRVPAPFVALAFVAAGAWLVKRWWPDFDVATIGSRFTYLADGVPQPGIPRTPPLFMLPWDLPGPGGAPLVLSFDLVRALAPAAFTIATLGAIESLLAAVVADAMAGHTHDPDAELLAQGTGNLLGAFFGGFAATGAIARTAANINAGGRSPVSAIVHALFLLAAVLLLAPLLAHVPMAALAAVLLMVAWKMSDARHFVHVLRIAPKSDVLVLLACFGLTVLIDMVVAVTVGVVLAALLFMRRMAELTGAEVYGGSDPAPHGPLPEGVLLYRIQGPLFFGAAQKAMRALDRTPVHVRAVILDVSAVPTIDVTGLVSLESAIEHLRRQHTAVLLAGLNPQPAHALEKAGLHPGNGISVSATVEEALEKAREVVAIY